MAWFEFVWSFEVNGNVAHIGEHGLTPDDFEFVFHNFESETISNQTGRPMRFGETSDGRYVAIIFRMDRKRLDRISGHCIRNEKAIVMTEKSGSRRRAPTAAEAERIRKAIAEESRPEVMAANRAVGQRLLAQKQQAATAAAEVLAQLLAEKERQQLSLSDLQERTGIGRSNLSRLWNQSDPKVTLETVERIAAALHCKLRVTLESTP